MRRVAAVALALAVPLILLTSTSATSAQIEPFCAQRTISDDPLSRAASDYLRDVKTDPARSAVLASVYKPCNFALAWTEHRRITPQALALAGQLNDAALKGLRPSDYEASTWETRINALTLSHPEAYIQLGRFDVDFTTMVMRYVSDLMYGRAAPAESGAGFAIHPDPTRIASAIWSLAQACDMAAAIQEIEPHTPGYIRDERALANYLVLARAAHDVPLDRFSRPLHPGDNSPALDPLALRLQQLGDFPAGQPPISLSTIYRSDLVDAVKHFQNRHGIAPSGVVDARTWKQLAVPLQKRVAQLALTLERWRWVPHTLPEPPVVVNLPAYELRAFDEHLQVALAMPVIVGRAAGRQSPVLQANITQVVFHPYWNVPASIQVHEIAPRLARDPAYLTENGFELVDAHGSVVHPSAKAALHAVVTRRLRLRQVPGARNALGAMKFVFPNVFDVYMHGTPEQQLFHRDRRDLSHGCIRVADPSALALWLLRHEQGWSADHIAAAVASPDTVSVRLSRSIPILIVYGTAIAAEDGTVRFFDDVYAYDASLTKRLAEISEQRAKYNTSVW